MSHSSHANGPDVLTSSQAAHSSSQNTLLILYLLMYFCSLFLFVIHTWLGLAVVLAMTAGLVVLLGKEDTVEKRINSRDLFPDLTSPTHASAAVDSAATGTSEPPPSEATAPSAAPTADAPASAAPAEPTGTTVADSHDAGTSASAS